jgi:putative component of membrane protein insertase Oxa1/YidC/SpoIIIJ protein YidD
MTPVPACFGGHACQKSEVRVRGRRNHEACLDRGYQRFLSGLPSSCRFYPSCSDTCRPLKMRKLMRLDGRSPYRSLSSVQPGGYDPVP